MPIRLIATLVLALGLFTAFMSSAWAADTDSLGAAPQQVESGGKKAGEGLSESASGTGGATVEGANLAGKAVVGTARRAARIVNRAGRAVVQGAQTTSETVRDRLIDFGDDVVRFLKRPF